MLANIPEKVKLLTKMNTPLRELASANDIALTIEFLISNKISLFVSMNGIDDVCN
jgi:hypothetical protein